MRAIASTSSATGSGSSCGRTSCSPTSTIPARKNGSWRRSSATRLAPGWLAFANVPGADALEELGAGGAVVHHPRWKAGVQRDAGAGWDFDDVRDHYLRVLFELDPVALRSTDPERYLELSRTVSG